MKKADQILFTVFAGLLASATAAALTKVLTKGWERATGELPPNPADPETPAKQALAWALLSGIGVGVAQLFVGRFAARKWGEIRTDAPAVPKVTFKLS